MSKLISIFGIFPKIFFTKKTLVSRKSLDIESEVFLVGKEVNEKIKKLFKGSLAIREVDAGSTNACEQELSALTNTFYDAERFGIHFVASPRHADMLMVTGPVSCNMKEALIRTYNAVPDPKIIVAVGDDAINGGIFKGSYAVSDGVDKVIPVDYYIPGDPPSPKIILSSLLKIMNNIDGELPKKLK
jgi:Ni,Fe-hydrogenase III small subunit